MIVSSISYGPSKNLYKKTSAFPRPQSVRVVNESANTDYLYNHSYKNFFLFPLELYTVNKTDNLQKRMNFSTLLDQALLNADIDIEIAKKNCVSEDELKNMELAKNILEIARIGIKQKNEDNKISFSSLSADTNKQRMLRNKIIIHSCATIAATAAGALAQTPVGDEAALTTITTGMAASLCVNYKEVTLSTIAPIVAQIFGKVVGEEALKYVLKWIPVVGNAANAVITFSLHEATGWGIVAALEELEKAGNINCSPTELIENGKELKKSYND